MDVAQLLSFLAVAEELHFARAAERLRVAQPPLSRTIKQLERELETRLFDRTTRSVRLTSSGQALVAPAKEVLDAIRRAEAAVQSADGGEVGLVRIAFAGVSTHRLIARLARVVRSRRPGIQLELSSQNFAQPAMKRLLDGATDIALGRWDVVPVEVSARVVMTDSSSSGSRGTDLGGSGMGGDHQRRDSQLAQVWGAVRRDDTMAANCRATPAGSLHPFPVRAPR